MRKSAEDDDLEEAGMDVLTRGFSVLEAFRPLNPWLSIHEIADATSMPRSTVGRLVATLLGAHYLEMERQTGKLRLGQRATALTLREMPAADVMLLVREWFQAVVDPTSAELRIYKHDRNGIRKLDVLRSFLRVPAKLPQDAPHAGLDDIILAVISNGAQHAIDAAATDACDSHDDGAAISLQARFAEELNYKGFATRRGYAGVETLNAVVTTMHLTQADEIYVFELVGTASELSTRVIDFELGPALAAARRRVAAELERFSEPQSSSRQQHRQRSAKRALAP
ncbi:DNA-binding transcriptional regulator, IclR family [Paraburkholderia steynii]|uniref:DNA-binding transcriptional regulator, IclR family n=1 Tax=Paraburkholderia steynii TaxID=1245441 RepID=A0A7Z7BJ17_9BURK|nr:helix-turn-helix domain-containing protein [Paraburkholderia steynii]SDJ35965.1 DNA-binding transcriptional regulator, IclR family [Paraburkholderia steynii]